MTSETRKSQSPIHEKAEIRNPHRASPAPAFGFRVSDVFRLPGFDFRIFRLFVFLCLFACVLSAEEAAAPAGHFRFPPPEFEGGYKLPETTTPPARALVMQYVDVAVLLGALALATWLTIKKRSRRGVVALSVFSLLYFGFYREGCICAIGSIQNVALALFDSRYTVPLTALIFCLAPIVFALVVGRAFCAAVCPHGAIQDLVLVRPVKIPLWLEHALGVLPFVVLGAGLLFAATGSAFLICRYDPFVPLFRMTGSFLMLGIGAVFLLVGMFIGRPFCRFLCPYGALLRMAAVVAKWRVRTTPDYCTQCRLCEQSCPFGALHEPSVPATPVVRSDERRRLVRLLLVTPLLVVGIGWVGSLLAVPSAKLHPTVALAEHWLHHRQSPADYPAMDPDLLRLKRADKEPQQLLRDAAAMRAVFIRNGWLLGGWIGLVLGAKLISLSLRRTRTDFEPDRGACVGCARCFEYCPNELVRRGLMPASALAPPPAAKT